MGRRQYLTIRKRRCNEQQTLKQRKKEKLFKKSRLIQHVYGMRGSITPSSCVVSKSSDVATIDLDVKRKDTECVMDN